MVVKVIYQIPERPEEGTKLNKPYLLQAKRFKRCSKSAKFHPVASSQQPPACRLCPLVLGRPGVCLAGAFPTPLLSHHQPSAPMTLPELCLPPCSVPGPDT